MALIDPRKKLEDEQNQISGGNSVANQAETGSTANVNSQATNAPDPTKIAQANQGYDFSNLLNPYKETVLKAQNSVNSAWNTFNSGIGNDDPWDNTETDALNSAINGQNWDAGKSVLNRQYNGPTTFSGDWQNDVNGLNSVTGFDGDNVNSIANMMKQTNPNLTAGQSRFDALLAQGSDSFKNALSSVKTQAQNTISDANSKQTQANELIKNRQTQAQTVRNNARDYLSNQSSALTNQIQNALQTAQNQYATPVKKSWEDYGIDSSLLNTYRRNGFDVDNAAKIDYGVAPNQYNIGKYNENRQLQNIASLLSDGNLSDAVGRPPENWRGQSYTIDETMVNNIKNWLNERLGDNGTGNNTGNNDRNRTRNDVYNYVRGMGYNGDFAGGDAMNWLKSDDNRLMNYEDWFLGRSRG